ncbi:MAG: preprotein translocase subunit YajC [Aquihabitans sp.]
MLPVLIFTIFLILIFWMVIIRPQLQEQRKYQRERQEVADTLVPGERVESYSGIHGTIVSVADDTVEVEIATGVVVTMARLAISSKLDEGGHDDEEDDVVQQVITPGADDTPVADGEGS